MSTPVFVDTMMRGTSRVRSQIVTYFENHLTTYLDTLRYQNDDLNEFTLPYPAQYLADDPFDTGTHTYPIVGAYIQTANGLAQSVTHLASGSQEFQTSYDVVVFVMVQSPYLGQDADNLPDYGDNPRASAMRLRDDYMAATTACLLGSPSLGTAGQDNRLYSTLGSIRQDYPEPMKAGQKGGPLWICSGLIHITITATERVANPIIGRLQNVELETDMLPFE